MVHFLVSLFEGICFAFRGKLDFKQPVKVQLVVNRFAGQSA